MIEEAHVDDGQRHDHRDHRKEYQRRVGRLALGDGHEQPPGRVACRQSAQTEFPGDDAEQRYDMRRKKAEQYTTERKPRQSKPFGKPRVVSMPQGGLSRLPQKDDAEEFDHDVAGEGSGKREQRSTQRQQHIDEGVRHFVRK